MMPDVEPVVAAQDEAATIHTQPLETVPEMPDGPADIPRSIRHDRLRTAGAIVFITTVVLGAAAVTLTRSPFFAARTIEVHGASHVARTDVLRIAALNRRTNVFTLDTAAAEMRLERDPWIAEATITKEWPSTLVIDIDERVAVAVVERDGVLRLVADDGALLDRALPRDSAVMPAILDAAVEDVEDRAETVAPAARAVAAMPPALRRRIASVSILADGQLRVDLSTGASVAYGGSTELQDKAMALAAVLEYASARGASVVSVDVRSPSAPTAVLTGGEVVTP